MKTPKWMAVLEFIFAFLLLTFVVGAIFFTEDPDRTQMISLGEP